ncbi:hypothetical protein CQ048_09670 [Pseudomonas trivialis]|nr:hypothetical protein CQ048_09670 [Pseudomonas trivialis]
MFWLTSKAMPVTKAITGRLSTCDPPIQAVAQNKSIGPATTRISPTHFLSTGRFTIFSTKAATAKSRIRLTHELFSFIASAALALSDCGGE